jgi:hypothetical protein
MSVVACSPLLRFAKGRASRHQKVLLNQWSEFWGEAQSDHVRAQGAILGKAMSALTEGKGLVLVLVTLQ